MNKPRESELCAQVTDDLLRLMENKPILLKQCIYRTLLKHFGREVELRQALAELVDVNERWNAAVQEIIGRAPVWNDGYLDRAREILRATAELADQDKQE